MDFFSSLIVYFEHEYEQMKYVCICFLYSSTNAQSRFSARIGNIMYKLYMHTSYEYFKCISQMQ